MKRIVTLLVVAVMMFTFAFSVNAETLTKGVNVNFVEDKDGLITTTVSAVGLPKLFTVFMGIQFDNTKVSLLKADKTTVAEVATGQKLATYATDLEETKVAVSWTSDSVAVGTNYVTLNKGGAGDSDALDCTSEKVLYKLYFKKADGTTIDKDTFTIYYKTRTQTGYQEAGSTKVKANVPGTFGFTVTPYTAPGGETWQETIDSKLPTGDDVKFPAAKGEDSTVNNDAKKVVIFAKNTSSDALVGSNNGQTANYGITIGGMYYPGFLDVPAGANWSIILVDPNGELTGKSFSASATVAGETKSLSNVSFE